MGFKVIYITRTCFRDDHQFSHESEFSDESVSVLSSMFDIEAQGIVNDGGTVM